MMVPTYCKHRKRHTESKEKKDDASHVRTNDGVCVSVAAAAAAVAAAAAAVARNNKQQLARV
jgi:hypothetical protein